MLKFSKANSKLAKLAKLPQFQKWISGNRKIYSFDLLAGWSCPAADQCFSKVVEIDGKRKVQDGHETRFRCYAASLEALYPSVYNLHKGNFDELRALYRLATGQSYDRSDSGKNEMKYAIQSALPKNAGIVRIHSSGDFFNRAYFEAWREIAIENPGVLFYAYTKQLKFMLNATVENFVLTASYGGVYDDMIEEYDLRSSTVVRDAEHAEMLGLEVDQDDSHAADPAKRLQSFALIVHGTQQKGGNKITLPVLN